MRIAVIVCLGLAGEGIVGKATFGVGIVVDQVDQAVELEGGLRICGGKQSDIVAVPAFVASTDRVQAVDVGEHVAPVIAVLDVVSQSKAGTEADTEAADIDDGDGEVAA